VKDDRLVVKLPAATVVEMAAAGTGAAFVNGGRVIRAWVTVGLDRTTARWRGICDQAKGYVGG
jgi:hypothetical protein